MRADHELDEAVRLATGRRGNREGEQGDEEDPLRPEPVAEPTRSGNEDRQAEDVADRRPLDRRERGVELSAERRDHDVHDVVVHRAHEEARYVGDRHRASSARDGVRQPWATRLVAGGSGDDPSIRRLRQRRYGKLPPRTRRIDKPGREEDVPSVRFRPALLQSKGWTVAPSRASSTLLEATDGVEPHSLMILRHGSVIAAGWWSPYTAERLHLLYSLSKSFTSTAVGFAAAEGLLRLDDPVISYFPELDAAITDGRTRSMLVRHIAAMSSGHLEDTWQRASTSRPDDPVRGFLELRSGARSRDRLRLQPVGDLHDGDDPATSYRHDRHGLSAIETLGSDRRR